MMFDLSILIRHMLICSRQQTPSSASGTPYTLVSPDSPPGQTLGMQVLTLLCVSLFFLFSTNTPLSTATRPTRAPWFPSILSVVCCPGAGCLLSLRSPFTTSYREGGEAR